MSGELGTHDRILHAAGALFRRVGFQAVGVDAIAQESGVAKMTLYRHFSSKDDLIVAYLELEDERIWRWLRQLTGGVTGPKGKLRAFFDGLERRTSDPLCLGCPFQMAAGEFAEPDQPARRVAARHKESLYDELQAWVFAAGLNDGEVAANQLYLLMEGAWAHARMHHGASRVRGLADAATMLIEGGLYVQALSEASGASSRKSD